jgi:hypothetical protein
VLQTIQQSEGYQNIARHFAELGWAGVAYELRMLIGLFVAILVVLPVTHFVMDRLERRGPKQ